jgi:hypothetical protein
VAVSTTVSYPSGVNAAVRQRDPVTITVTGLTANTNYVAFWDRPGTAVSERVVRTDGTGTLVIVDNPQVSGTHSFQLGTTLDTFIPGAPTMTAVETTPTAIVGSTASYTVG